MLGSRSAAIFCVHVSFVASCTVIRRNGLVRGARRIGSQGVEIVWEFQCSEAGSGLCIDLGGAPGIDWAAVAVVVPHDPLDGTRATFGSFPECSRFKLGRLTGFGAAGAFFTTDFPRPAANTMPGRPTTRGIGSGRLPAFFKAQSPTMDSELVFPPKLD